MDAAPNLRSVAMTSGRVCVGSYAARDGRTCDVELAYDVFGTSGRPLVLVMGIGAQRVFWDEAMCELFVHAGFHVVRFDHRDIGQSTKLDASVPPPMPTLLRGLAKLPIAAPYTLSDMAHDVIGLVRALGWQDAHMVGVSMGGMIVQHLALEHPEHTRSITAIMTTPGGRRYMPEPYALRALFEPAPKNAEEAGLHAEKLFTLIGSKAWAVDGARMRQLGAQAYAHGVNPRGFLRHFAAVLASGDRRDRLRDARVPTLVIHGSRDPMFPLSAGRKLAELTRGTWLPIAGMGHDLPTPLWPTVVAAIARHAKGAEARATTRASSAL